jgi:hypothetical protein
MILSDKNILSQKWACAENYSLIATAYQSVLETLPLELHCQLKLTVNLKVGIIITTINPQATLGAPMCWT